MQHWVADLQQSTVIMTTALSAAISSNEEDDAEEETCPVCYEPNPHRPAGDAPTSVACEVCKHAESATQC